MRFPQAELRRGILGENVAEFYAGGVLRLLVMEIGDGGAQDERLWLLGGSEGATREWFSPWLERDVGLPLLTFWV